MLKDNPATKYFPYEYNFTREDWNSSKITLEYIDYILDSLKGYAEDEEQSDCIKGYSVSKEQSDSAFIGEELICNYELLINSYIEMRDKYLEQYSLNQQLYSKENIDHFEIDSLGVPSHYHDFDQLFK